MQCSTIMLVREHYGASRGIVSCDGDEGGLTWTWRGSQFATGAVIVEGLCLGWGSSLVDGRRDRDRSVASRGRKTHRAGKRGDRCVSYDAAGLASARRRVAWADGRLRRASFMSVDNVVNAGSSRFAVRYVRFELPWSETWVEAHLSAMYCYTVRYVLRHGITTMKPRSRRASWRGSWYR